MDFCCKADSDPVFPDVPVATDSRSTGSIGFLMRISGETADAIESHENFNLINNRFCGKSSPADRIVGGNLAVVNQFPWLVLLEYRSKDDEKKQSFKCGGTLITEKYVLTGNPRQS